MVSPYTKDKKEAAFKDHVNLNMKIKKKVGILTLPLHTNYGGNLQAYALMKVLKGMGHDVSLIKRVPAPLSIFKQNYLLCKQLIKKYVLLKNERISFISYK